MVHAKVAVGDVLAFMAAHKWVPCQVIGARNAAWEIVVFAVCSATLPRDTIINGASIYVLRRGKPRNEPLYLVCTGEPPATFQHVGNRPVQLAFTLPTTFRTSPRAWEDKLPVWATWTYAIDRVELDLNAQALPFRSKFFPGWKTVDPRALRAIDAAVTRFAALKPATEAALRKCVVATNKYEEDIHTIEAEELCSKLIAIAEDNELPGERATAVIEATRAW